MSIERKRLEAEHIRVYASRIEMELRVAEFEEKIERLKKSIEIQTNKEKEIKIKIDNMGANNG